MKRTPGLPFRLAIGEDNEDSNGQVFGSILDCDDFYVARIWSDQAFAKEKAILLVTAANHFEEVVEMLKIYQLHNPLHNDTEAGLYYQAQDLLVRIKAEMEDTECTTT